MINLLPPFARKYVLVAYWTRVTALALFAWALAVSMGVVMLGAVYLQVDREMNSMQRSVGEAEELQAFITDAASQIDRANDQAQLLLAEDEYESFTTYVAEMERIAGTGVQVTNMSLQRATEEEWPPVQITAVAETRQDLISFLDAVEAHPLFGSVDIPIANLSQSQNIQFSLRVPIVTSESNNS